LHRNILANQSQLCIEQKSKTYLDRIGKPQDGSKQKDAKDDRLAGIEKKREQTAEHIVKKILTAAVAYLPGTCI
jgi:hypothetical protein